MMSKRQAGKDLTLMSVMAQFSTEEAAIRYFEAIRWPKGLYCPHCGNADAKRHYSITANRATKIRPGLHQCAECRLSFTVRLGTIMEDSHIPLNKWLIGFYMMCASKTQVSAVQLQRQLEIGSYSAARFFRRRIRFALMDLFPDSKLDGTIEADETYIGGRMHGKGRVYKGNRVSEQGRGKELQHYAHGHIQIQSEWCAEAYLPTDYDVVDLDRLQGAVRSYAVDNVMISQYTEQEI